MVSGIGVGCSFQPTLIALQAHSPKSRRAVIISNRNFFRCAGGACGLAIAAAVLQARLRATLPPAYAYLAHSTYSLPKGPLPDDVLDAYMDASHGVFLMQIPIIGACFAGMIFVRDKGLDLPEERREGEEQSGGVTAGRSEGGGRGDGDEVSRAEEGQQQQHHRQDGSDLAEDEKKAAVSPGTPGAEELSHVASHVDVESGADEKHHHQSEDAV
jgi:hypothetical protein